MEVTPPLRDPTINDALVVSQHEPAISIEFVAYAALILLALVLRIAQLDVVPLTNNEARQALAALRVVQPDAPGSTIVPESPLLFFFHSLSFSVLGASEFSTRIWTSLGSLALILSPVLFRDLLGRGRALILTVLLAFSPVLLLASRSDSPVVWTLLVSVLALWLLWRYYVTAERRFAATATLMVISAALLTDPTGMLVVLMLVGAGVFAFWSTPREVSEETGSPAVYILSTARERLQTWPWQSGILVSAAAVLLTSTLFMLYPEGLSAVSSLLGAGARGLTIPRPNVPFGFPFLITIFYEPVLVVAALIAIGWMFRRDELTFVERFLVGWLVFALLAALAYAGTGPEHALWLILPLAGLVSSLIARLLARVENPLWWDVPTWGKWVIMLAAVALLGMFAIHIQSFARALINSPEGTFQLLNANTASVVWVIISLLFMVIGFFLASSIWGIGTTAQGAVLAVLFFSLATSLGSGWRAAVVRAESPVELWNRQPISSEVFLLRETVNEIAHRQTNGLPKIPIMALTPDDGAVAWVLRDFVNTRFIVAASEARTQEIVLLPDGNEPPNLGGSYVGQKFNITSSWNPQTVQIGDVLAWWLQQKTRLPGEPSESMVLWLRQDIYNGVPIQSGIR